MRAEKRKFRWAVVFSIAAEILFSRFYYGNRSKVDFGTSHHKKVCGARKKREGYIQPKLWAVIAHPDSVQQNTRSRMTLAWVVLSRVLWGKPYIASVEYLSWCSCVDLARSAALVCSAAVAMLCPHQCLNAV